MKFCMGDDLGMGMSISYLVNYNDAILMHN